MFTPITNQRLASLAGVNYDCEVPDHPPIIYGRTHTIERHVDKIKKMDPVVLITSFSDASLTDELAKLIPSNVHTWFSNNVMTEDPRVKAVPIGMRYSAETEKILFEEIKAPQVPRTKLCYVCFYRMIPRTPNPREGLYEFFLDKNWCTIKGGFISIPTKEFYQDIKEHKYVLSPPGAGLDCHRTWEALALGSIPIMLRSRATAFLEDLPCLLVDNWYEEVTEENLERQYPKLLERFSSPKMQILDFNYWKWQVIEAVK